MADGYILIDTEISTAGLKKGVSVLEREINKTTASLEKQRAKLQGYFDELDGIKQSTDEMLKLANTTEEVTRILEIEQGEIDTLNAKYKEQLDTLNKTEELLESQKTEIEMTKEAVIERVEAEKQSASAAQDNAQAAEKVGDAYDKIPAKIDDSNSRLNTMNNTLKSALKKIVKYGLGVGGALALFNKLKSAAKDGLDMVAESDERAKAAMDAMNGAFNDIKMALGKAIVPLIQALAPIVQAFVPLMQALEPVVQALVPILNALVPLVKTVAELVQTLLPLLEALAPILQIIATILNAITWVLQKIVGAVQSLFGLSANDRSYKNVENLANYYSGVEESAVGASAAIKEMQRNLSGLDEINTWEKQQASYGGGGGLGGGLGNTGGAPASSGGNHVERLGQQRREKYKEPSLFEKIWSAIIPESVNELLNQLFGEGGEYEAVGRFSLNLGNGISDAWDSVKKLFAGENSPQEFFGELFGLGGQGAVGGIIKEAVGENGIGSVWDKIKGIFFPQSVLDLFDKLFGLGDEPAPEKTPATTVEDAFEYQKKKKLYKYDRDPVTGATLDTIGGKNQNGRYRPIDALANRDVEKQPKKGEIPRAYGIDPKELQTASTKAYRTVNTFYNKTKGRYLDLGESAEETVEKSTSAVDEGSNKASGTVSTFYNRTKGRYLALEGEAKSTAEGTANAAGSAAYRSEQASNSYYNKAKQNYLNLDIEGKKTSNSVAASVEGASAKASKTTETFYNTTKSRFMSAVSDAGEASKKSIEAIEEPYSGNKLGGYFNNVYKQVKDTVTGTNDPGTYFGGKSKNAVPKIEQPYENNTLGKFFGGVYQSVKDTVTGTNDPSTYFGGKSNDTLKKVEKPFENNTLGKFFGGRYEEIKAVFSNENSPDTVFGGKTSEAVEAAKSAVTNGGLVEAVSDVYDDIKGIFEGDDSPSDIIGGAFGSAYGEVKKTFPKTGTNSAKSWFTDAMTDPLKKLMRETLNDIIDDVNKPIKQINTDAGNRIGSSFTPIRTLDKLPALATGAVIPPNAPFVGIMGDQKHGTNIETPEDLLRKIVREESGRGGNGNYQFVAQINRKTLFDEIFEEAKIRKRASGRNPFTNFD